MLSWSSFEAECTGGYRGIEARPIPGLPPRKPPPSFCYECYVVVMLVMMVVAVVLVVVVLLLTASRRCPEVIVGLGCREVRTSVAAVGSTFEL